jgi:EXLDI family protein
VPNKTIYVSDGDLPLYQRAQELAGGNLSAAIAGALRRFVDLEEGRGEGFDEIVVRVGAGPGRKVRFMGILLGRWDDAAGGTYQSWHVYRTRGGRYALFHEHAPEFKAVNAEGKPAGWRGHLGIGNISYGSAPRSATLDVFASLEELRDVVPGGLWELVARSADEPDVEDLDL